MVDFLCPHCREVANDYIYAYWLMTQEKSFIWVCAYCGNEVDVNVTLEPHFFCHKKEGD